jgi:hypothetical protein
VAEAVVPPPMAEKVVSISQDDSDSSGEGSDDLGSDDDDGEGSVRDDGEGKAIHIPFRMTPSGIMWYKCPIFLAEEYDLRPRLCFTPLKSSNKTPDMVKHHRHMLQAR